MTVSLAEQGRLADYLRTVIEALPNPPPLYCLVGAMAVNAWGRIRTTQDIALLVLSEESVQLNLTNALVAHGFQPDNAWVEHNPLAKDRVVRLAHPSFPGLPLDLIFSLDSHEGLALARRRSVDVLGVSVWIASPEDLILLKLKASRPHDFEDALGIVKNPRLHLDLPYLWTWADRLGLHGELHYLLAAAG